MNNSVDKVLTYTIHEVAPYINWIYFFHAWGFQPKEKERAKAAEAMQLFKEANQMLNQLDKNYHVHIIFRLCEANADGDNPFLCLSDFVRPLSSGIPDTVGIFAASCDGEVELLYENDTYKRMLVQTLADRLAEAATEKMHEYVRKVAWGYAKDENLSIPDLLREKFQGIRPAVGYPSLPDQSVNFLLNDLLHMEQIGITLTENGAMRPHATVCGLILAHPAARYFAVGKIGNDQLEDYARRRKMSVKEIRKFLAANL